MLEQRAAPRFAGKPGRPFLVVSTNVVNELRRTVVGVPLTTGGSEKAPLNIPIIATGRLSHVVIHQVRAIDKYRRGAHIGYVSAGEMEAVENALHEVLEL